MPRMFRKLTLRKLKSAIAEPIYYGEFLIPFLDFCSCTKTNFDCVYGQRYKVIDLVSEQHIVCYSAISIQPKSDKYKLANKELQYINFIVGPTDRSASN